MIQFLLKLLGGVSRSEHVWKLQERQSKIVQLRNENSILRNQLYVREYGRIVPERRKEH